MNKVLKYMKKVKTIKAGPGTVGIDLGLDRIWVVNYRDSTLRL